MGSWDSELLDNDTALDYVGNLVQRVIGDLNADLETLGDGVLERNAGACVSVLSTLVENYYTASAFITPETIENWRHKVSVWLADVAESESRDRDAWLEYAKAFAKEFDRLAEAVEKAG